MGEDTGGVIESGGSPLPREIRKHESQPDCDHDFIAVEYKIVDKVQESLAVEQTMRVTKIFCPKCQLEQLVNWG